MPFDTDERSSAVDNVDNYIPPALDPVAQGVSDLKLVLGRLRPIVARLHVLALPGRSRQLDHLYVGAEMAFRHIRAALEAVGAHEEAGPAMEMPQVASDGPSE